MKHQNEMLLLIRDRRLLSRPYFNKISFRVRLKSKIKMSLWVFLDLFGEREARPSRIYKQRRSGDDNNYRDLYRFSRENVTQLTNHFLPASDETRGGALSNIQKMQTFLRYMADPGFQVGVGEDLGINQSTVSQTVHYVCDRIVSKASNWIHFPANDEEMKAAKALWKQKHAFPHAIGAIDCTLIPIKKPSIHGDEYVCRKQFPAINVQATCDGKDMFTSVDATWAGSVHDARIWRNSPIAEIMARNTCGALLLGDEGYPLTPWLMTVYRETDTAQKKAYNNLHILDRTTIERMFGQLKRRFPILGSEIRVAIDRIPKIIVACFVLHNIAKHLNDSDFDE